MLKEYRKRIESALALSVVEMGEKNRLRDAVEYSLKSGGKRIRPLIVLMVADALSMGLDVMPVALSVEFFHTASLVADDLPCMDNDDFRRSVAALHKQFGDSVAILASYTLVAAGYEGLYKNKLLMSRSLPEKANEALEYCLAVATRCAGIQGATNGQFLDLFPPNYTFETIEKIIYQKTITLFEIAFTFGWLFGGGSSSFLEPLRSCAYHLGMAFQIADDLEDGVQDASFKATMNVAAVLGRERAISWLSQEIALFKTSLEGLGLWTPSFQELYFSLFSYQTDKGSVTTGF